MFKSLYKKLAMLLVAALIIATLAVSGCNINVTVKWYDADGTLLTTTKEDKNDITYYKLPSNTEVWQYNGWEEIETASGVAYRAKRKLRTSYFSGNVFQIITYNLDKDAPVGTGSGFVFNEEGWFFTNYHVMENAYYADAVFNIPNKNEGESFTALTIENAAYSNEDKDLFIGKITGYDKIKSHYKEFTVSEDYGMGDTTYSIGYPNSSIDLKIHEGKVLDTVSTIYDKVSGGNKYIKTSSFCAPGSSGGILINENLEVIGITSQITYDSESGNWLYSLAISAFNFIKQLEKVTAESFVNMHELLHPKEVKFIKFFDTIKNDPNVTVKEEIGKIRYIFEETGEGKDGTGTEYTYEHLERYDSEGLINYYEYYYWATGERCIVEFTGYYTSEHNFDGFHYWFGYQYDDGSYYQIESQTATYSFNMSLTLKDWELVEKSFDRELTKSEIKYFKEVFNLICEMYFDAMEIEYV